MFTSGGTSLWVRNVQLGVFAIPLQAFAIYRLDWQVVSQRGLFHGFHPITWLVVVVQVAGALLTAIVIKFAGNILKTFATVLALLLTCVWSMVSSTSTRRPLLCWHRHHRDVGVALCAARHASALPGYAVARLRNAMGIRNTSSIRASIEADPAYFHEGKSAACVRQAC